MNEGEFNKRMETDEPVNTKTVRDEFHSYMLEFFEQEGFERVKEDVWLRKVTDEIDHVIRIEFLRSSHHIILGFRLAFAPRINRRWVRRHTLSESAWEMQDLVHDPYNHLKYDSTTFKNRIGCTNGLHYLRHDISKLLEDLIPYTRSYFQGADSLEAVLDKFESERDRRVYSLGFDNRGRHFVSYPFLLARLGNLQAAEQLLTENFSWYMSDIDEPTRAKLLAKLHEVASS